jgi:hypothetical protein
VLYRTECFYLADLIEESFQEPFLARGRNLFSSR